MLRAAGFAGRCTAPHGSHPILELVADRLDQGLADAPPLPLGAHRDRPEKAEAAPACREIRADQLAVELRSKARDMLGPEPAIEIVAIGPEILGIRRVQERPESGAANLPRLQKIARQASRAIVSGLRLAPKARNDRIYAVTCLADAASVGW